MSPSSKRRSRIPFALLLASIVVFTASTARGDTAWPHEMKTSKGSTLTIYEPQLDALEVDRLSGHAACSVRPASGAEPIFGAFWFTATVKTDAAARTVKLVSIDVTNTKFPDRSSDVETSFATVVERELPKSDLSWSTDWMNDALRAAKDERAASAKISNTPPAILVSTEPAVLIQLDGEPQLRPIENSDLSRVVNTPYFIAFDPGEKNYYLGSDQYWYESKDAVGPWKVIDNPPSKVLALKPQDASAATPKAAASGPPPNVIVATRPTELIVFRGEPQFSPVANTDLLHVTNSDKDVFKDVASQNYYVLLSGRWFSSAKTSGPWTFVPSDRLPASFAAIPAGSEFARVLASVPGTPQAADAVLAAQVPQVTAVPRGKSDFEVWYDEDPEFRKIKGTDIEYAVNTSTSVFKIDGKYYACDEAVWYVSNGPDGPWSVCDKRPEGLEGIPPDNPNYNTKYVYVYDSTPSSVYVGYTPGYLGCYPYGGSVYYGTGYYYDPWYGSGYYAYPWTWGFGVTYAPYAGWGFSFGFGTGFVNCGLTWGHGYYGWPYYGSGYYGGGYYGGYGYCGGWYGPGGYYPVYNSSRYTNGYYGNYGNTRTRTTVGGPTSIYDRQASRYRGSNQVGGSGKQYATRNGYVARNGSRYGTQSGNRYSAPTRNRSTAPNGSRYSAPRGNRYDRSYGQQGNSRYRDRSAWSRSGSQGNRSYNRPRSDYRGWSGNRTYSRSRADYRGGQGNRAYSRPQADYRGGQGNRAYSRPQADYRGGQSRGYQPQSRGNVPQSRGMQGGGGYGRNPGGGGGGHGGGGGGARHR